MGGKASAWMIAVCGWWAVAGCTDTTAILVHIEGTGAEPVLQAPGDVDELALGVHASGSQVASEHYLLGGDLRPLAETVTLVPGSKASGEIVVQVEGLHAGTAIAAGSVRTSFERDRVAEVTVALDWIDGVCLDADGDGYGRGPACPAEDCDDADPDTHPGAGEACNGRDDDCDGATDEGGDLDPPRCELVQGVCAEARQTCGGRDGWQACTISDYGPDYQDAENRCDGLDNDCDGAIDELCPCTEGDTRDCSGSSEGVCTPGSQVCERAGAEWVWGEECDGVVLPSDETCNQLDDDCDGQTDEDFDLATDPDNCGSCGTVCAFDHGTAACREGVCALTGCEPGHHDINGQEGDGCEYPCTPAEPPVEACNEQDDDCDGETDEDFDLDTDPDNCGSCGNVCVFDHGTGGCQAGVCVLAGCDPGHHDANDDASDGCEYPCTPTDPPVEVCDGHDNDCDGETDGAGAQASCSDADPCTSDVCVEGACQHPLLDADEDGHAADHCGGDDCDDGRDDVHPGAAEQCDEVDHDCDGSAWDVVGQEVMSTSFVVGDCWPSAMSGSSSIAAAPDGTIGIVYGCHTSNDLAVAVLDQDGEVLFSDLLTGSYRDATPRIASIGQDSFLMTAVDGYSPDNRTVFRVVDRNGFQGETILPENPAAGAATIATAPWNPERVVAVYLDFGTSPARLMARELDATPAFTSQPLDVGVRSTSGDEHESGYDLIRTADGLVVVGCADRDDPLEAAWITAPDAVGGSAQLADTCAYRLHRGSVTYPPDARHALLASSDWQDTSLYLIDITYTQSITLLESELLSSDFNSPVPLPLAGSGLAAVDLTSYGNAAIVWLVSDGDPGDMVQVGEGFSCCINDFSAVSLGGGRVAFALSTCYEEEELRIWEGTCTCGEIP